MSVGIPRSAMIEWIVRERCSHALTLNFNRELSLAAAANLVGDLLGDIERRRYGREFVEVDLEHRLVAFAFPEHVQSNIHFHVAMRFDDYWRGDQKFGRWSDFIGQTWRRLTASGSTYLEHITEPTGWARYILKDFDRRGVDYWLAADFHSVRNGEGVEAVRSDRHIY